MGTLANLGTVLSCQQVKALLPKAWSRIPKVYREQERLQFFLSTNGKLRCLWFSAPKDHQPLSVWDVKKRLWSIEKIDLNTRAMIQLTG